MGEDLFLKKVNVLMRRSVEYCDYRNPAVPNLVRQTGGNEAQG
jgi:hypothetical protein